MGRHSVAILTINRPKNDTKKQGEKMRRWGLRSCLALLLAATVTTTTIYSQVLYAQAETGEVPDNRISFTFQPLEKTVYELETKGTQEETLSQLRQLGLPETLTVMTQSGSAVQDPVDSDMPEENITDGSGNTPDTGAADTDAAETTPDSGVTDTDAAETTPDPDVTDTDSTGNTGGSGAEGTDSAENTDGSGVRDSENTSGSDAEGADAAENTDGSGVRDSVNISGFDAAGTDSSENGTSVLSVIVPDTPVNSAPEETPVGIMTLENNAGSDVTNNNPGDNTNPDEPADPPVSPASSELPVTWSCDHYEEIRDSYLFTPKWDEKAYRYDGKPEEIPVITVTFKDIPGIRVVSSEDQLKEAFQIQNLPADGSEYRIVLMNDIALTETLNVPVLPAGAKVILESKADVDGSGKTKYCSLTRGSIDSGAPFTGAMLHFGTPEVSQTAGDVPMPFAADQNAGGTLTLRNVTIDGKRSADISDPFSPDNQVNAPAVISSGHLILGKGACIINNYNFGTYLTDENGKTVPDENGVNRYVVPPCGGGIWVCGGALELQKGCRIQFNAAGLRGGGIYLDTGAVLCCYTEAEALTGNSVFTGGVGGDLYACPGSTIYYDPAVFIPWNSFYIDPDVVMIPEGSATLDTTTPIEIYLHVGEDSGYSYREVKEKLESTFGDRVTVLLPQTYMIDTTDLRNWYVYDHYDTNCWNQADANRNSIPDSWEQAYREYRHRPYYGYTPQYTTASVKGNEISAWLENPPLQYAAGFGKDCLALAPLKEHLYSRTENGKPEMTFVGYDRLPNVDFLFYNPQSDGQKTVEFDVDSSNVNTHTLAGTGFLLNTGISEGNLLSGYLLYYTYLDGGTAINVSLYRFNDINTDMLHSGTGISLITAPGQLVKTYTIDTGKWESRMSIKIIVDSDKITVTQRPKDKLDASVETFIWDNIEDTGFNGFGPLVAYSSHACFIASSFTYSNLRMQFVNPDREKNLLSPLTEADFSQQGGVKRYYLNLLGESQSMAYADESGTEFGDQYHEFLYMMQDEGIGLITDAKTPFAKYLGPTNISPNLFEVPNPDKRADLSALIVNLQTYLSMYPTTELPENLDGIGLERAHATKPIGNIWLADANNVQLSRVMNANALPPSYIVNIMDIACDLSGKGYTASYSLKKPGSSEYEELPPLGGGSENAAVYVSRSGGIGASFVITNDPVEWPAGQYTVKQTVSQTGGGESAISGYSYFTLTRSSLIEDPSVIPPADPSAVSTSSGGSSGGSAPVLAAPEITAPDVVRTTVTSDGASQPKTGDGMFPAMPVACGACTAFMMKIMLWMYDVDFDIVTEYKEELVRSLILWGKGSARPRIYIAIIALTAVITAYHLLKAFVANSKRIVRERLGI